MPNVVLKQKAKSYKTVFIWLYSASDQQGLLEFNATLISKETGVSIRSIYYALAFLQRVNLLKPEILRTGRGNHSTYRLNWRKSASISINKINIHSLRNDRFPKPIQRQFQNDNQWNRKMKGFRELLKHSWLLPIEQNRCVEIIGRFIKHRSTDEARKIYERLKLIIRTFDVPIWVRTIQQLCAWFTSVLKGLIKKGEKLYSASRELLPLNFIEVAI